MTTEHDIKTENTQGGTRRGGLFDMILKGKEEFTTIEIEMKCLLIVENETYAQKSLLLEWLDG